MCCRAALSRPAVTTSTPSSPVQQPIEDLSWDSEVEETLVALERATHWHGSVKVARPPDRRQSKRLNDNAPAPSPAPFLDRQQRTRVRGALHRAKLGCVACEYIYVYIYIYICVS